MSIPEPTAEDLAIDLPNFFEFWSQVEEWTGKTAKAKPDLVLSLLRRTARAERDNAELRAEVERLKEWKGSAMSLLGEYDAIAETFAGRLGSSKITNLARGISELRTERDELRKRLVALHKQLCDSPKNCILDGGPEHMQAFELIHGKPGTPGEG